MLQKHILEGIALFSDPFHSLTVRLGEFIGIIPREEGAVGITEGTTRDIALLTRVGQPVCAVVTGFREDGTPVLSRRLAQELAYGHFMKELRPGQILPATVTHLEPFGAFVDIGCGIPSLLGIETLSISHVRHPSQRFSPGQEIFAVVTDIDRELRRVFLSHKELLGTWQENASQFSPGMTVTGTVRSVKDYGVFVELTPNLSGLAETDLHLKEGDRLAVFIKSILPDKMKVKLVIMNTIENYDLPKDIMYFTTEGHIDRWDYSTETGPKKIYTSF